MAVPSPTTSTSIPHGVNAVINPRSLPKQYAIPGRSLHPAIKSDDKQIFSTVDVPKEGDVVAIWRNPETLASGELHVAVYRLLFDLNPGLKLGDRTRARTPHDIEVYVETIDQKDSYRFFGSEIEAIHKWVGIWPKGSAVPQIAAPEPKKEPAPPAPVTEQAELSLLAPTGDGPITMSSREIAELLGDRHDSVKRTIERLVARDVFASPPMVDFKNINGVTGKEYRLDKRSSLIVVAQLSPEFTAKVVDRWQELEGAIRQPATPQLPNFSDPVAAARAWADAKESEQVAVQRALTAETQIAEKNAQIADMREDVDALDRIAKAEGSMCITDAAKTIQVDPKKLFAFLRQNRWIYRRASSTRDVAYQAKIVAGLLEHKTTTVHRTDGSEKVATQVLVTPKGLARLAKLFPPAAEAA